MSIDDNIVQRIQTFLEQAPSLTVSNECGQVRSEQQRQQCAGWLAAAQNIVQRLCPAPDDAYRVRVDKFVANGAHLCANEQVGEVAAILRSFLADAQDGLLSPDLKAQLERRAREEGIGLAALLERISREWLRAEAAAMRAIGTLKGGDPERSERVRERVRAPLPQQSAH